MVPHFLTAKIKQGDSYFLISHAIMLLCELLKSMSCLKITALVGNEPDQILTFEIGDTGRIIRHKNRNKV